MEATGWRKVGAWDTGHDQHYKYKAEKDAKDAKAGSGESKMETS